MKHLLTRAWRERRGAVAVEMALITPVILLLLAGTVDFGLAMYNRMQLSSAIRAGIQYALHHSADPQAIRETVLSALTQPGEGVAVAVTQECECADGSAVSCTGGICPLGRMRTFVHIEAGMPYRSVFLNPMLPIPDSLQAQASVRVH